MTSRLAETRPAPRRPAPVRRDSTLLRWGIGASLLVSLLLLDPLPGLAALELLLIWHLTLRAGYPTAFPAVLTLHWLQLFSGIYYEGFTGREVDRDYGPFPVQAMGYVGLVYLAVFFAGVWSSTRSLRAPAAASSAPPAWWRARALRLYLAWIPIGLVLTASAWSVPGLTQQVLALSQLRFVFLAVLVHVLVSRRAWRQLGVLLTFEVALGFTGFFADWRLVLLIGFALLVDAFRGGNRAAGRIALVTFFALALLALIWTGIKEKVRAEFDAEQSRVERLVRVVDRSIDWVDERSWVETTDRLVARVWELEFPARVLDRVPRVVPHEDGELLLRALRHVLLPRFIDPNKPRLISDSVLVRKYAGVNVAGEESGASIGLSFVAESYIDFGVPVMFVPLFAYGWLIGWCIAAVHVRVPDLTLRSALTTTLVIVALCRFEVPWTKVLGTAITVVVVSGGALISWQRFFAAHRLQRASAGRPTHRPGARRRGRQGAGGRRT